MLQVLPRHKKVGTAAACINPYVWGSGRLVFRITSRKWNSNTALGTRVCIGPIPQSLRDKLSPCRFSLEKTLARPVTIGLSEYRSCQLSLTVV